MMPRSGAAPSCSVFAARAPQWSALDTALLLALTSLAGVLRLYLLSHPHGLVFDEFYASDACLYVSGPGGECQIESEIGVAHPPLARWLIGGGIRLLGFTPLGWRLAPFVAGTASIAVLYLLARRLLGSTFSAALAAALLSFDFLHFVMSRTAMLDIFVVLFGLSAFVCVLRDSDRPSAVAGARARIFAEVLRRPWLLAAGAAGGAALACKWSGGYLLAGAAGLALLGERERRQGVAGSSRQWALDGGPPMLVAFVVVPLVVYALSYVGRLDGTLLALPWTEDSWVRAFLERQQSMLEHHTGPLFTHPYTSPAWSWPLLKRPVLFFFRDVSDDRYQEILALGSPLVWWTALVAMLRTSWTALRRKRIAAPDTIILVGFAAGYIPWLVITRQEAFLYYFLPAVPFLYLATARVIDTMVVRARKVAAAGALLLVTVGSFAHFGPLLIGRPLTYPEWERRMWFRDCGPPAQADGRQAPVTQPVPPPKGWCWI
jgi:dolichyl-phosphate-mannose-protein mannosyltransferase